MVNIRKQFPVLSQTLYANTAAFGLMSEGLQEWRQEHDLDYLIGGGSMKLETMSLLSETRDTVGRFFGCHRDHISLVPNFSIGLNMLAEGLEKNRRILLLEGDYPSLNWPFEHRGFTIWYVPISERLEEEIREKVRNEGIDVLALSLVQWLNGILVDLEWLKQLKREFPDLLIIADGTQFCGTRAFNFEDSGIDVLGASGYKWLLAGSGNGIILFSAAVARYFSVKAIGFNSANVDLGAKSHIRFAKYLEPGHLDSMSFGSLGYALRMLADIGMEQITAHNRRLMACAKEQFSTLGLLESSVVNREDHSTIFNIRVDDHVFRYLRGQNITCAQRGDGVRLGFHFYNTESEIETIVNALRAGN